MPKATQSSVITTVTGTAISAADELFSAQKHKSQTYNNFLLHYIHY